jgi:hypothetical protein
MEISKIFFYFFYHFLLIFAMAGNKGPYPRRIWYVRQW